MKKVLVLLNRDSGALAASTTCDEPERIARALRGHGWDAEVRCVGGGGDELADLARGARDAGVNAVIVGGGDGTLNGVANALAGGPVPFGVLPLGTHNHFAKELGVPLDLDAALAALADGGVRDLDVAEVNGRVFLNFSGIGLHPKVVTQREVEQRALGGTRATGRLWRKVLKLLAGWLALARTLGKLPLLRVTLTAADDGGGLASTLLVRRVTPSVIVCNNVHQMRVFGVGNVSQADRSVLNVYVAKATTPVGLARLMLAALFRRLDTANAREFEAIRLPAFRIATRRRRVQLSIDGEVVDMATPLEYRVRRGGLKVIVPRE